MSCTRSTTDRYCWGGLKPVLICSLWRRGRPSGVAGSRSRARTTATGKTTTRDSKKRRGNDALWKAWKTKSRFPTLPTTLGNRIRDSHISTAPTRRGKVENQPQVFHFPTFLFILSLRITSGLRPSLWSNDPEGLPVAPECYLCRRSKVLPMSPDVHLRRPFGCK